MAVEWLVSVSNRRETCPSALRFNRYEASDAFGQEKVSTNKRTTDDSGDVSNRRPSSPSTFTSPSPFASTSTSPSPKAAPAERALVVEVRVQRFVRREDDRAHLMGRCEAIVPRKRERAVDERRQ